MFIHDAEAPAHEMAASRYGLTREEWEAEKNRMRTAGSLAAWLRVRRPGTRVRLGRVDRHILWQIAHEVRETPHRGTLWDYHRTSRML